MAMQVAFGPLTALVAGILILVFPRLLNVIVAVYLILFGVIGLMPFLLGGIPGAS